MSGIKNISRRRFIKSVPTACISLSFPFSIISRSNTPVIAVSNSGLKDYAPEGFKIGSGHYGNYGQPDLNLFRSKLVKEFNHMVLYSGFTMGQVRPIRNASYDFSVADEALTWASKKNLQVSAHQLIFSHNWPVWLDDLSREEMKLSVLAYIDAVVGRYASWTTADGQKLISDWGVVGEAFEPYYQEPIFQSIPPFWSKFLDEQEKNEFIAQVFERVRLADSEAYLGYHDVACEIAGWPKTEAVFEYVQSLKEQGLVDVMGFECHFPVGYEPDLALFGETIRRFGDIGVKIRATEMDSGFYTCSGTLDDQAQIYGKALQQLLENQSYCLDFSVFSMTDHPDHNWILSCDNPRADHNNCTCPGMPGPSILDENYQKKPAYFALEAALKAYKENSITI